MLGFDISSWNHNHSVINKASPKLLCLQFNNQPSRRSPVLRRSQSRRNQLANRTAGCTANWASQVPAATVHRRKWWWGLCVPVILGALLSWAAAPCRVSQGEFGLRGGTRQRAFESGKWERGWTPDLDHPQPPRPTEISLKGTGEKVQRRFTAALTRTMTPGKRKAQQVRTGESQI